MKRTNEISKILGLILARSGSQRVRNKNARPFAGTTLLELAVEEALKATSPDRVGLSTDSPAYLELAESAGLQESYIRPEHLAGPAAGSVECVIDYVAALEPDDADEISHVLLLQPTSPFRTAAIIDSAVEAWRASGAESLVSVMTPAHSPDVIVCRSEGKVHKVQDSEDLQHADIYVLDGAIYLTPLSMLRERSRFWDEDSELFINRYPSPFDIDTEEDFAAAEAQICSRAMP